MTEVIPGYGSWQPSVHISKTRPVTVPTCTTPRTEFLTFMNPSPDGYKRELGPYDR